MGTLEELTAIVIEKGEALGLAHATEQALEDDRAAIKADAIVRVMARDKLAATPAEKIVETDAEYFNHRAEQRASIVARFRADAEYKAAQAALTQASLITPSMIELETKIKATEKELRTARVMITQGEIAYRRSNSMLSDRINDVERLTDRNRKFWDLVEVIVPRPMEVYDAWEQSKDQGSFAIVGLEATRSGRATV